MITEMEKIAYILQKGKENSLTLAEFIELQIKEFECSDEYKEMLVAERYAENDSDIKNKKRTYIDQSGREVEAPLLNNAKIKYPIFLKLLRQKTGYLLKKPITLKTGKKEYLQELEQFFNSKKHKQLKNTMGQAIIKGIAWWYVFVEDNKLKAKLRYANEIIPIWKDREHEELDAIIVRYFLTNYTTLKGKEKIEKVEYHDFDGVRFFIKENDKLIPDIQKIEENSELQIGVDFENNPIFANFKIGNELKVWEKIPFVYFKYNAEEMPLIHLIKSLVDEIENLKSAASDRLVDSVDGVDVVKGYSGEAEKFQKNLQTFKTVFLDSDGEYSKIQNTIDITAFKEQIEQLRKDVIYIGSGVDTEADKLGNNYSGIALQMLFEDLDLDCSNIEAEFLSSLEYFKFFFDTFDNAMNGKDYFSEKIEYIFNKSLVTDETAKIENIRNSENIISNKTRLANHPYVTNVEEELKQLKEEKEEDLKQYSFENVDNEILKKDKGKLNE